MSNPDVTHAYYFYPCMQTYSKKIDSEQPYVSVKVTTPNNFPADKLNDIIKQLGNYMTLQSLRHKSRDTESNYCDDYSKHAGTCVQDYWQYCNRHLTKEEIEECLQMEKKLDPLSLNGIHYQMSATRLSRGEIDTMRRILDSVRRALKN